jgi:hypothetical protein
MYSEISCLFYYGNILVDNFIERSNVKIKFKLLKKKSSLIVRAMQIAAYTVERDFNFACVFPNTSGKNYYPLVTFVTNMSRLY